MRGNLLIHETAEVGNYHGVAHCLRGDDGVHPDVLNSAGETALYIACVQGNSRVARVLLDAGADPNIRCRREKNTALVAACELGHYDLLRELIKRGADTTVHNVCGQSILHEAAVSGSTRMTRELVRVGADLNTLNTAGWTPLSCCAEDPKSGAETARILIEGGADCNIAAPVGHTALMFAAKKGNTPLVRALVDGGANVSHIDNEGWSPLLLAVQEGHKGVVRLLCRAGADTEVTVNRMKPLMLAIMHGQVGAMRELLRGGADVNAGPTGETPIFIATRRGRADILGDLIDAGAQIMSRTYDGRTPLHFAASVGHLNVARVLLKAGCLETATTVNKDIPATIAGTMTSVWKTMIERGQGKTFDPVAKKAETACMLRLLAQGPAFRARPWLWPAGGGGASTQSKAAVKGCATGVDTGNRHMDATSVRSGDRRRLPIAASALRRQHNVRPPLDFTKVFSRYANAAR